MKTRVTLSAALLAAALSLPVLAVPAMAQADCNTHPRIATGAYVNVNPSANSIRRLHLSVPCTGAAAPASGESMSPGTLAPPTDWRIRMWGVCSPTDCDWGNANARENTARSRLRAGYDQGFARRTVTVVPVGAQIEVTIRSVYTDGRPSATWVERFRRG
jgi:hypothetical protein